MIQRKLAAKATPEDTVHHPEDEQVEQEDARADPEVEPQFVRISKRGVERLLTIGLVQCGRRQAELHRRYQGVVAGGQHQDRPAEAHAKPVDVAEEASGQDDGRYPGDQEDRELRPHRSGKEPGYHHHHRGAGQVEEHQRQRQGRRAF